MNKVLEFWEDKKDTIKNVTIMIAVPMAVVGVVALMGIQRLNRVMEENNLNELFYGDPEEEEA